MSHKESPNECFGRRQDEPAACYGLNRLEVVVSKPAAALAACCTLAAIAMPSLADAPHLRAGDTLSYDVSMQSQQSVTSNKPGQRRGASYSSAGTGTETLQIVSVDADGTAHGSMTLTVTGMQSDQPLALNRTVSVSVSPDGRIVAAQSVDPLFDQTIMLANASIRDLAARDLGGATSWQWKLLAPNASATYTFNRVSRGQTMFLGLPTYAVQTTGGMDAAADNDPTQPVVAIAGTFYYDQRDRLFIGEAMRTDSSVFDETSGVTLDSSALVTIALRAFQRGPEPQPSPSASPLEAETPPTPTPAPTGLSPLPVPTVTPSTT